MSGPPNSVRYSLDLVTRICERVAQGEFLKRICGEPDMPHFTTFYDWMRQYPEAARIYRDLAWVVRAHGFVDEILALVDEAPERVTVTYGEGEERRTETRIDPAWVNLQRLRADKRQWVASRLCSEYGDRVSAEITGKGGAPIAIAAAVASISDADAMAIYAQLVGGHATVTVQAPAAEDEADDPLLPNGHGSGELADAD
jgi:hypothetical protein